MIDARESIRLIWRSGHDGADLARRLGVDRPCTTITIEALT